MSKSHYTRNGNGSLSLEDFPNLPPHYQILSTLGEGAFSRVYKGVNTKSEETVAIKVINKTNLCEKQIANINNEISVMNTLANSGNHPNILKLIESFESEENSYLVLDYCDGGEIFDKIIEHTYLSEDLARHVFLQLLEAVRFMHENNIVHRDIKPENLLFKSIPKAERPVSEFTSSLRSSDDDSKVDEGSFIPGVGGGGIGTIKLADFGLAKQLKFDATNKNGMARSNLKTPCGTAGYTAPEVIHCGVEKKRRFRSAHSKSNFYSKSVDVWSLGCFLYTSLCGFPPFYDDDNEILTHKILTGDFVFLNPWWDEISDSAKDLITKMLVVSAESRITIESIYNHPWMANATPLKQESYFPEQHQGWAKTKVSVRDAPPKRIKSPMGMTGGLASPKIAIKQVFDNPAMSYVSLHSLAQSKREKVQDSTETVEVKFDSHIRQDAKYTSSFPRTPNPMHGVSFGDVFNKNVLLSAFSGDNDDFDSDDVFDDSDEDDAEDSEDGSDVDTEHLSPIEYDKRKVILESDDKNSITQFQMREEIIESDFKSLSLSSPTSVDSQKSESDRVDSKSLSMPPGVNGEFEFTLNLNDSNLLRRRSSTKSGRNLKTS